MLCRHKSLHLYSPAAGSRSRRDLEHAARAKRFVHKLRAELGTALGASGPATDKSREGHATPGLTQKSA